MYNPAAGNNPGQATRATPTQARAPCGASHLEAIRQGSLADPPTPSAARPTCPISTRPPSPPLHPIPAHPPPHRDQTRTQQHEPPLHPPRHPARLNLLLRTDLGRSPFPPSSLSVPPTRLPLRSTCPAAPARPYFEAFHRAHHSTTPNRTKTQHPQGENETQGFVFRTGGPIRGGGCNASSSPKPRQHCIYAAPTRRKTSVTRITFLITWQGHAQSPPAPPKSSASPAAPSPPFSSAPAPLPKDSAEPAPPPIDPHPHADTAPS